MAEVSASDRLDRHALVMAIWAPSALLAAILLHKGLEGGSWWIFGGFVAIILAFAGHVIVNTVLGTGFTAGERALAMSVFAASLVALLMVELFGSSEFAGRIFLPMAAGLGSLVTIAIFYLVIVFGARAGFEQFDVIRDNNPRMASRLKHRGGRR